jgi:hypothetical protein
MGQSSGDERLERPARATVTRRAGQDHRWSRASLPCARLGDSGGALRENHAKCSSFWKTDIFLTTGQKRGFFVTGILRNERCVGERVYTALSRKHRDERNIESDSPMEKSPQAIEIAESGDGDCA